MFKSDILKQAFEIKDSNARKHSAQYQASLQTAQYNIPRLSEIDFELSKIGASLMSLAISGKTDELSQMQEKSLALKAEKELLLEKCKIKAFSYLCPICNDTGRKDGKVCTCVKEIAKTLSLNELKATTPIEKSRFEDFDINLYPDEHKEKMQGILNFCSEYAESFNLNSQSILFIGKCGLGKTHLSLSIAEKVLEKGYGVVYGSSQDLFAKAEKEHFSYSALSENRDNLLNCDLLILDDLGAEFTTNFTQSLFYNIVNTRILSGKPTIINTNLSFDELTDRYTARIASRFLGEYTIKQFAGNDIRQIKAIKKLNK